MGDLQRAVDHATSALSKAADHSAAVAAVAAAGGSKSSAQQPTEALPTHKALYRRGCAHAGLLAFESAAADLMAASKLQVLPPSLFLLLLLLLLSVCLTRLKLQPAWG